VADRCQDGKAASNWVTQDVQRVLKERGISIEQLPVTSAALAELIAKIKAGELPSSRARDVLGTMIANQVDVGDAMRSLGIASVDAAELTALCARLVAANPKIAGDVRNGKTQAVGALVGQAKQSNPNVDPNRVRELCLQLILAASG